MLALTDTTGLTACTWYYFALKTRDEANNWSGISNVVSAKTLCSGSYQVQCGPGGEMVGGDSLEFEAAPISNLTPTVELPKAFQLLPSRPNPFKHRTIIPFELPQAASTTIDIFDAQGRLIKRLVHGVYGAGRWTAEWDRTNSEGRRVEPGVYLYRMQAGVFEDQRRMVLIP